MWPFSAQNSGSSSFMVFSSLAARMVITGVGRSFENANDCWNNSRICSNWMAVFRAWFALALLTTIKFALRASTHFSSFARAGEIAARIRAADRNERMGFMGDLLNCGKDTCRIGIYQWIKYWHGTMLLLEN